MMSVQRRIGVALGALGALALTAAATAQPAAKTTTPDSTAVQARDVAEYLPNPVGIAGAIDGRLVVSVNWPDVDRATRGPGPLYNLQELRPGFGPPNTGHQFSHLSGIVGEVRLAVAPANSSGYGAGTIFFGSNDGFRGSRPVGISVGRMANDGTNLRKFWSVLPGADHLVTGLAFDTTGQFGGWLLALTSDGKLYGVAPNGNASLVTNIGSQVSGVAHARGIAFVPNEGLRYGPLAGKIIIGGAQGGVYTVDQTGKASSVSLPSLQYSEDVQVTPANSDFYGVDFARRAVVGLTSSQLSAAGVQAGDVLIADAVGSGAFSSGAPLWQITWSLNRGFQATQVTTARLWQQTTFVTH